MNRLSKGNIDYTDNAWGIYFILYLCPSEYALLI